ncbi:glutathione S-transferase family protein [Methylocystis sp. MJC1]|jgi:glutathione S-transferase|uniref:glutathione S-transferase family protein n=1 Tax=Methylocystis sp. MJC1 TaxID=2654282 RepID=UPI0013EC669E|nr:glutathione S-transferase family protein [Methylocystis sp. MJC1]KAF2992098.1 Glutathione S-transferase GstB [Methylocystis sp. MJC1]MBU6527240.1 glutathione S-transferase family protein [Methylocystis sp. MJC1]UZX10198.1 glutathione S-transferase family protein [Methylocystis sp. MJC1]
MLTLYGQARSRASRSLWALEEIGVPYQHIPIQPYTESRSAEYLRVNPNGHVPCLNDNGFVLWESLAINLYLAETYAGASLWPADEKGRARMYQWTLWAANEIEPRIIGVARSLSKKEPEPVAAWVEQISAALRILDDSLRQPYLLGDDFTVADINLASTLREPGETGISSIEEIDVTPFPNVTHWLDRCSVRPANRRVAALAGR